MKFKTLNLPGAFLIELEPVADNRGSFTRLFCKDELNELGLDSKIAQINFSLTEKKGTIRGLHVQGFPAGERKILRCLKGKIWDVILDLRKGSSTFLKWQAIELSEASNTSLYIPEGFAHGFQTLEHNCELLYLHSKSYQPGKEASVRFDDPKIGIKWPLPVSKISDKDLSYSFIDDTFEGVE